MATMMLSKSCTKILSWSSLIKALGTVTQQSVSFSNCAESCLTPDMSRLMLSVFLAVALFGYGHAKPDCRSGGCGSGGSDGYYQRTVVSESSPVVTRTCTNCDSSYDRTYPSSSSGYYQRTVVSQPSPVVTRTCTNCDSSSDYYQKSYVSSAPVRTVYYESQPSVQYVQRESYSAPVTYQRTYSVEPSTSYYREYQPQSYVSSGCATGRCGGSGSSRTYFYPSSESTRVYQSSPVSSYTLRGSSCRTGGCS